MSTSLDRLLDIMAQLRNPDGGCPWDVEQTFASIAPYTIEEAYEVADAIESNDLESLRDELGDLLLQVVFHAQMASEIGAFDFAAVTEAVIAKMVTRHPHVFGDKVIATAAEQTRSWEAIKAAERAAKATGDSPAPSVASGALDGVARGLPALMRANKLQRRAARVGFDWAAPECVLDKIAEEIDELTHEMETADAGDRAAHGRLVDEVGDVLFTVVNLARKLDIDPESALRHANHKFEARFRDLEQQVAATGATVAETTLEDLEQLWQQAKLRLDKSPDESKGRQRSGD